MSTTFKPLSDDPAQAERELIRALTDAYSLTPSWAGDGDERAEIEKDIRAVTEAPAALGLSPEASKWILRAESAGIVWTVADDGFLKVSY